MVASDAAEGGVSGAPEELLDVEDDSRMATL